MQDYLCILTCLTSLTHIYFRIDCQKTYHPTYFLISSFDFHNGRVAKNIERQKTLGEPKNNSTFTMINH